MRGSINKKVLARQVGIAAQARYANPRFYAIFGIVSINSEQLQQVHRQEFFGLDASVTDNE